MPLLQGQHLTDVARDVPDAPVGLANEHDMTRERVTKRAFGGIVTAEVRQRHREIVGQIRNRQRARTKHLLAHGDGLSQHGLRLLVRLQCAEQAA